MPPRAISASTTYPGDFRQRSQPAAVTAAEPDNPARETDSAPVPGGGRQGVASLATEVKSAVRLGSSVGTGGSARVK